jgi:hypothetical protein
MLPVDCKRLAGKGNKNDRSSSAVAPSHSRRFGQPSGVLPVARVVPKTMFPELLLLATT